jgi:hypothetical protein
MKPALSARFGLKTEGRTAGRQEDSEERLAAGYAPLTEGADRMREREATWSDKGKLERDTLRRA